MNFNVNFLLFLGVAWTARVVGQQIATGASHSPDAQQTTSTSTTITTTPPPFPYVPRSVCPNNWTNIDMKFCMRLSTDLRSWNDATATCHADQSHLLILDEGYYKGTSVNTIISYFTQLVSQYPGLTEMWTGLHVISDDRRKRERFWWESDVPIPYQKDQHSYFFSLSVDQPNTSLSHCAAVIDFNTSWVYPNYTSFSMKLDNCNNTKRFICVRESIEPILKSNTTGCPSDWLGSVDLDVCYEGLIYATANFSSAQNSCKSNNSRVAFPKDDLTAQFFLEVFAPVQIPNPAGLLVWVGDALPAKEANATLIGLRNVACSLQLGSISSACLYVSIKQDRSYWFCYYDCGSIKYKPYYYFICEMNKSTADKPTANVIERNVSLSLKPKSTTANLTCNASNFHPSKEVVWVKDGFYFGNGLPPGGLHLRLLGQDLLKKLSLTYGASLQGEYHCEVWGQGSKFKRVPERGVHVTPALVTSTEEVATFRGTINSCYPISNSDLQLILSDFFEPRIPGISFEVEGPKWISGPLAYDFTVYYGYNVADVQALQTLSDYLKSSQPGVSWEGLMSDKLHRLLSGYAHQLVELYNATGQQMESVEFRRTDACCEQSVNGSTFNWAPFGSTSSSNQLCPLDLSVPKAVGICSGDFVVGGSWSVQSLAICPESQISSASNVTKSLRELSQTTINGTNIENVVEITANLTSSPDQLTAIDVAYSAEILNSISTSNDITESVARDFVRTVSNIADVPKAQLRAADEAVKKILTVVEKFTDNVDLDGSTNLSVSTPNVAVQVWDASVDRRVYGFASYSNGSRSWMRNYRTPTESDDEGVNNAVEGAIILSEEAMETASRGLVLLNSALNWKENLRVSFIVYKDGSLFSNPAYVRWDSGSDVTAMNVTVDGYVISGMINGQVIENLTDPVKIILKPKKKHPRKSNSTCAYWEHDVTSDLWGWSTKDLWSNWSVESSTWTCFSRHLTNFAIIAGFDEDADTSIAKALRTVSIIGICLSIIGLSLTIIAQLLFKATAKGRSQLVLLNLAVALLAVDILVLAGVDRTDSYSGCIAVAALLLYFLLASFCWMLVEGVIQYLKFVKVFDTYTPRFMLKAALPAWGVPLIPVILVAAIDHRQFRGPANYCWLAPTAFHFAFLLPLGLIWLTNLILFIVIIKGITCDRPAGLQSNQKKRTFVVLQVQAAACCAVVMGLTWLFCLLSVDGSVIAMDFLFCIFNSLQGFFIFLFVNVREKPIRNAWLKLLHNCCCCRRCLCCCCRRSGTTAATKMAVKGGGAAKEWNSSTSENQDSSIEYNRTRSSSSSKRSSAASTTSSSLVFGPMESQLSGVDVISRHANELYNY